MDEQRGISRRRAISGIGVGFAAVAAGSRAFGAEVTQKTMTPEKLQDPTNKYPNRHSELRSSPGRDWPLKWIRVQIMERRVTRGRAVSWAGRRSSPALIREWAARPRSLMHGKAPMWRLTISQQKSRMRKR